MLLAPFVGPVSPGALLFISCSFDMSIACAVLFAKASRGRLRSMFASPSL